MVASLVGVALIIAVIAVVWFWLQPISQSGGSSGQPHLFPFSNPFQTTFFHPRRQEYHVVAEPLHHDLVDYIIGDHSSRAIVASAGRDPSSVRDADFFIGTELGLNRIGTDWKFVCSLYAAQLLILAPNSSNIIDMGDIEHYGCPVTVGINVNQSVEATACLKHLLWKEGPNALDNTRIIVASEEELLKRYGTTVGEGGVGEVGAASGGSSQPPIMLYLTLTVTPDAIISKLTEKVPSHFVSTRNVNSGELHITYSEEPFYKQYPFYRKSMVSLERERKFYPYLSATHNRDLYLPTIKTSYVLVCRDSVSAEKVEQMLHKVLYVMHRVWSESEPPRGKDQIIAKHLTAMFREVDTIDLTHMTTKMDIHPGAKRVYRQLKLHELTDASVTQ